MSKPPHVRDFHRYPMLLLATYFACGVGMSTTGATGAFFFTVLLLATSLIKRDWTGVVLPLIFIPLGILCSQLETLGIADNRLKRIYDERRIESDEPVEIEGVLVGFPDPAYGGSFLKVRVTRIRFRSDDLPASGDARLFLAAEGTSATDVERLALRHGSIVRIACRLQREEHFLNPGVTSAVETLDRQGMDAVGIVKSPLLVERLGEESVFLPMEWAYRSRLYLIERFHSMFSPQTAGVMIASLLGDDNFLDRRTADAFREGGTFHVLVISGLHITFIGGLALWVTAFFTQRMVVRSMLAAGFLWAYTLAVGAEIPVIRASLMFSFLLIGRLIYRDGSLVNALGACTLLILAWRPSDLFSASFQLTFVSVAAIVGCSFPLIEKLRATGGWYPSADEPLPPNVPTPVRRFCELLYWNEEAWRIENRRQIWKANLFKSPFLSWLKAPNLKFLAGYVFEGLLVSVIVQIAMLPLLVIYFHRVSPPGLVLNLWVGIFLAVESFAAIGAVFIAAFSAWLAAPLVHLTEFSNAMMMSLPQMLSELRVASARIPVYSGALKSVYVAYAGGLLINAAFILRWEPFALVRRSGPVFGIAAFAFTVIFAIVIIFHPFSSPAADGLLKVEFLDVGQGDSALVTFPDGKTMLIDGGGRPDFRSDDDREFEPDVSRIGERVVSEFLWEKGYSQIDYLVATHADADHIQGLTDVARNFRIGKILVGKESTGNPDFEELLALARDAAVQVETLRRGDELDVGPVKITVLNPSLENASRVSANNASVVLRLAFGRRAFLLTGDIERETEAELTRQETHRLHADVVKVPHHGSKTSSTEEFVKEVGAASAIISVGRRSRFGHPHAEVVKRWVDTGANVVTTGASGTISVETDGDELRIRSFRP